MGNIKVLVVDDDEESRRLLNEVLTTHGYHVETVGSVAAARESMSREAGFEVVIADLRMPGEGGLELLRSLRGSASRPALILMSSFIGQADRRYALDLGAHTLLEKPFRLAELVQVVGEAAARGAMPRAV